MKTPSPPDQGQGASEKDDGHVHGNPDAREGSPEVHGPCQVGTALQVIPDICHFFYTGKIFGE